MGKVTGEIILEKIQEFIADRIAEENTKTIVTGMTVIIGAGIGLEKGHFPETLAVIELGVQAIVDQGQDLEEAQTGIE